VKQKNGTKVTDPAYYGSIVSSYVNRPNLPQPQAANVTTLNNYVNSNGVAVKYHSDYTRVLEDALQAYVVSATSQIMFYAGTIDLYTMLLTKPQGENKNPNTLGGRAPLTTADGSRTGKDSGAYYRVTYSGNDYDGTTYYIRVTDEQAALGVTPGDAVVINRNGAFDLFDARDAQIVTGEATALAVAYDAATNKYSVSVVSSWVGTTAIVSTVSAAQANAASTAIGSAYSTAWSFKEKERIDRVSMDGSLQLSINGVISDNITQASTARGLVTAEASTSRGVESTLSTTIGNETSTARGLETEISHALSAEISNARVYEGVLSSSVGALSSGLSNEISTARGQNTVVSTALSTVIGNESTHYSEVSVTAAAVSSNLSKEIDRAEGVEKTLSISIATLSTNAASRVTTSNESLSTAIGHRISADDSLSTYIGNETSTARGKEAELSINITNTSTNVVNAASTAQGKLSAEISTARGVESTLSNDAGLLSSALSHTTGLLSSALSDEVARAGTVEKSLSTAISQEISNARAQESSLSSQTGAEAERAKTAEGNVSTAAGQAVNAERIRASNIEIVLQKQIFQIANSYNATIAATATRLKTVEAFIHATEQFVQMTHGNGSSSNILDFSSTFAQYPASSIVDVLGTVEDVAAAGEPTALPTVNFMVAS